MTPDDSKRRYKRIESIFQQAVDLTPHHRADFLAAECGDDLELLREVETLLHHGQAAGDNYLSQTSPLSGDATERLDRLVTQGKATANAESSSAQIGPYRLLEVIGEGGFGTVWMAEQREPVQRRVALKIIKLGMDTKQVVARFEAERQALAMMDHPNIAKVFDGGATESGRPYFVMELVRGVPVTRYCDENRLGIRERLNLFRTICQAVQHAHQKGVIHRDIKPSNVMVTLHDGSPVPKVIDFGISKAIHQRLTEKTLFTEYGQFIGTPEYVAPEQAEISALDVDTRADIYSLGILLYELLTGTTPLDAKTLRKAGYAEMQRMIREHEALRPSTRLSTLKTLSNVAADRGVESGRLSALLRGDLDWIVMKALEKDRTRRYETANGFAEDIRRYLEDEPVMATPPSRAYRMRKFVRRNRVGVIVASIVSAAMLLATGISISFARSEARQRATADLARRVADERRIETQQVADFQSKMLSEIDIESMGRGIKERFREQMRAALAREWIGESGSRRRRTDAEVGEELGRYDGLATNVQGVDVARQVIDAYVLQRAGQTLDKQFGNQPLVQAELRESIGRTYRALGVYESAEPYLKSALDLRRSELGGQHADVAISLDSMATLLQDKGDYATAEALFREALAMRRSLLGNECQETATSLTNLAVLLYYKGDYATAEPLYREALAINRRLFGESHPDVPQSIHNLALLLLDMGNVAEAEPLFLEALSLWRKLLGNEHPDIAICLNNLGFLYRSKGDYGAAEPLYLEALAMRRKLLGDDHPDLAINLNSVGFLFRDKGDLDSAERYYRDALAHSRKCLGDLHPNVATGLNNLAALLRTKGDYAGAESLFRESLEMRRRLLGDEHPEVANSLTNLGILLRDMGNYAAAEPLLREALATNRKLLGEEHPEVANSLDDVAMLLRDKGDLAAAEPMCRQALELNRKLLGEEHPDFATSLENLAMLLKDKGDYAEAEPLCRQALAINRKVHGTNHPDVGISLSSLGMLLLAKGDYVAAEPLFREALAILEKRLPPKHRNTVTSQVGLGRALVGLGKFAEAESLLVGAEKTLDDFTKSRLEVIRHLAEMYDAWSRAEPGRGHDASASRWRAELAAQSSRPAASD